MSSALAATIFVPLGLGFAVGFISFLMWNFVPHAGILTAMGISIGIFASYVIKL